MKIEEFSLERIQSLYENTVEFNLSDSGVHPYSLNGLLDEGQRNALLDVELGYGWTNGAVELREAVARLYRGRTSDEVIVTNGSAEANFLMVMSLLEPGDEIVVFVPNYLQIWGWARAIGVTVKEVAQAETKVEAAKRSLQLYREGLLSQAELSFRSALAAYQTGRVEFVNLLEAQRALRETRMGYYKATANLMQNLADLERAVGKELQ